MNPPKPVRIGLALLLVTIWGAVAFRLSGALSSDEPVYELEHTAVRSEPEIEMPPPYIGDFRDPFTAAIPRRVKERPSTRQKPNPPQARLLATIDDAALVQLPGGETRYVRAGDQLDSARVSSVGNGELKLRRNGTTYQFTLKQ